MSNQKPQSRKRISLGVLILIGVGLGIIFKNLKAGLVLGLIFGLLLVGFAFYNKK